MSAQNRAGCEFGGEEAARLRVPGDREPEREWLSTREVANRVGYSQSHVRKLLRALDVPSMRITKRSHPRWHWATICALFHVPQTINCAQTRVNQK